MGFEVFAEEPKFPVTVRNGDSIVLTFDTTLGIRKVEVKRRRRPLWCRLGLHKLYQPSITESRTARYWMLLCRRCDYERFNG